MAAFDSWIERAWGFIERWTYPHWAEWRQARRAELLVYALGCAPVLIGLLIIIYVLVKFIKWAWTS
jgi:hypothetical protein